MDIGFASARCVKIHADNDSVAKTFALNNGQDGSLREQSSRRTQQVKSIMYNYPDQSTDEQSSVVFICRPSGQLYYIEILVADFSVTLDVPVNPLKFSADYLRRVLLVGGKFSVNKKATSDTIARVDQHEVE